MRERLWIGATPTCLLPWSPAAPTGGWPQRPAPWRWPRGRRRRRRRCRRLRLAARPASRLVPQLLLPLAAHCVPRLHHVMTDRPSCSSRPCSAQAAAGASMRVAERRCCLGLWRPRQHYRRRHWGCRLGLRSCASHAAWRPRCASWASCAAKTWLREESPSALCALVDAVCTAGM